VSLFEVLPRLTLLVFHKAPFVNLLFVEILLVGNALAGLARVQSQDIFAIRIIVDLALPVLLEELGITIVFATVSVGLFIVVISH